MPREQKIGSTLIILIVGFSMAYLFRKPAEKTAALPELAEELRINQQLSELRIRPLLPGIDLEHAAGESPYENRELARELAGLKKQLHQQHFQPHQGVTTPPPIGQLAPVEQLAEREKFVQKPQAQQADLPQRRPPVSIVMPKETVPAPASPRETSPPQWRDRLHESSLKSPQANISRLHVVSPGETLTGISLKYYGTVSRYLEIFEANRGLMSSPNQIRPGMQLQIPGLVPDPLPEPEIKEAASPEKAELSQRLEPTGGFNPFAAGGAGPGLTFSPANQTEVENGDRRRLFVPAQVNPFQGRPEERLAEERSPSPWR